MILDSKSRSDTYPYIEMEEQDVTVGHEASVSRIGEEQFFYLKSRGLSEAEASTMIVNGFIEPLVKELPMEYAVEMNRLIELQMEGTVECPNMTMPSIGLHPRSLRAFLASRREPEWLVELRREAWNFRRPSPSAACGGGMAAYRFEALSGSIISAPRHNLRQKPEKGRQTISCRRRCSRRTSNWAAAS